jgi:hypothetical protein
MDFENEQMVNLCEEFITKIYFNTRAVDESILQEWRYFKIILNNPSLHSTQTEQYFNILRDKLERM